MDSLTIPIKEPTKISYIRKDTETGMERSFVSLGFLSHKETVTRLDAAMGKIFIGDLKEKAARNQFAKMKTIGQTNELAHFLFSRLTKTHSLKIPIKLGTIPPTAPKNI